jgi:hypothetical protein
MDALRPVSTERKCRICRSPKRAEVEALLARLGETDDVYGRLTLTRISKTILPALDGGGPSSESACKRHKRLHAESTEAADDGSPVEPAWVEDDELQALISEVGEMAAQPRVSPGALLNLQQRLYLLDLRRRLARGESVAVTADAAARAAAQLQKTEREAEEGEFLRVLGAAIGSVFSRPGAIQDSEPVAELIEGDGEVAEEAEVEERRGESR